MTYLIKGARLSGGDAADLLIRLAHEYPGELRVIAIGPLTNLAIALERDPALAGLVAVLRIADDLDEIVQVAQGEQERLEDFGAFFRLS